MNQANLPAIATNCADGSMKKQDVLVRILATTSLMLICAELMPLKDVKALNICMVYFFF